MAEIKLNNASVEFPIYGASSRSLKKQLLRVATGGQFVKDSHKKMLVKALNNLNLEINHGDRVGIIGHNGAGKSTLLRVLSKIYEPTQGSINIKGDVTSLLDMTLGMNAELTGYENIVLKGIINGHTRKEIVAKKEDIAQFTQLGDFLNMPIRTYSAGMNLRLAFAIATSMDPEILIIDEVISAGDANFQEQASKRIDDLIRNSHIVIIASHDQAFLKKTCTKLLWLDAGNIKYFGAIDEGLEKYKQD